MNPKKNKGPKYLVGVGASAGGLEPLQELLAHLPEKLEEIAIIVAQHLSPNYKSMLVELLARKTKLPVYEAKSGLELQENAIYTVPPDNDAEISDGFIQLKKLKDTSPKPGISELFKSIAQNYGSHSAGIILSGTGIDGSKGIIAIRESGGITIAQSPSTAKYDGMPNAAIATNCVDLELSPDEIGERIEQLLLKRTGKPVIPEIKKQEPVTLLLRMLEERVGTDFSNYKTSTIYRRLEKRMSDKKIPDIDQYIDLIKTDPRELDALFEYMLIGVTSFFRNPEVFIALEKYLSDLIASKGVNELLRVWISGCATGEEAYSLAILIHEIFDKQNINKLQVQVFATDIDQNALNIARMGVYDEAKLDNLPEEIIHKYFVRKGDSFEVVSRIKKIILFSRHDVLNSPPFLRMDLISCRNLLIYFNQELQKQLLPVFHYSLNTEGILLLGKSESVAPVKSLFLTLDAKHKIYQRRPVSSKLVKFPHSRSVLAKKLNPVSEEKTEKPKNLSITEKVKETLFGTIEDPYIVTDENLDMVEIKGDVSPFLSFREGLANTNIIKQINSDLQIELRALTTKSLKTNEPLKGKIRKLLNGQETLFLRIAVKPLLFSRPNNPYLLIVFEKLDFDEKLFDVSNIITEGNTNPRIVELEQELEVTKEHMNTLIEELEASNEELQALNEELQSSNEELQASNEELETSNEELQATNEELETAYTELNVATEEIEIQHQKIKESENNLKTLLNNTLQGFILVDKNYKILTYNKVARDIYANLFNKELEERKSYVDFIPTEQFNAFRNSFQRACNGEVVAFEEVKINVNNQKKYLLYNYTPVETGENPREETSYICISFIDETARKIAENKLQSAYKETEKQKEQWELLTIASPDLIGVLKGKDLVFEFANPAFNKYFKTRELIGKKLLKALPELIHQEVLDLIESVKNSGNQSTIHEVEMNVQGEISGKSNKEFFNLTFSPFRSDGNEEPAVILYGTNITEQVNDRKQVEKTMKYFRQLTEAMPQKVWTADAKGNFTYLNKNFFKSLGAVKSMNWFEFIHPRDKQKVMKEWEKSVLSFSDFNVQHRIRDFKDNYKWYLTRGVPFFDNEKKLITWIGTTTDIHEQKSAEEVKEEFLSIASHELKTPLTTVKAYCEIIKSQMEGQNGEVLYSYVEKATEHVNKLNDLISDLLDITRIENGSFYYKKEKLNFDEFAAQVVENFQHTTTTHRIIVKGQTGSIISGDPQKIEQVFMNLLSNAVKYSPNSDQVVVKLDRKNGNVAVSVEDYGIGIPKEKQEKVFKRFYRVSEGNNHFSGLGIGLYISKEIISNHNGKLFVESEEGKGSIFTFLLPEFEDIKAENPEKKSMISNQD